VRWVGGERCERGGTRCTNIKVDDLCDLLEIPRLAYLLAVQAYTRAWTDEMMEDDTMHESNRKHF